MDDRSRIQAAEDAKHYWREIFHHTPPVSERDQRIILKYRMLIKAVMSTDSELVDGLGSMARK